MVTGNFDIFPREGESQEQFSHRLLEGVLAEDWKFRFQGNGAEFRALGAMLGDEDDPEKVVGLTEQRGESLIRCLGSGAISLWQDDVLTEREQFEAKFGEQQQRFVPYLPLDWLNSYQSNINR